MKTVSLNIEFHRYTANFNYCLEGFFLGLELYYDGIEIPNAEILPGYTILLIELEERAKNGL